MERNERLRYLRDLAAHYANGDHEPNGSRAASKSTLCGVFL